MERKFLKNVFLDFLEGVQNASPCQAIIFSCVDISRKMHLSDLVRNVNEAILSSLICTGDII